MLPQGLHPSGMGWLQQDGTPQRSLCTEGRDLLSNEVMELPTSSPGLRASRPPPPQAARNRSAVQQTSPIRGIRLTIQESQNTASISTSHLKASPGFILTGAKVPSLGQPECWREGRRRPRAQAFLGVGATGTPGHHARRSRD